MRVCSVYVGHGARLLIHALVGTGGSHSPAARVAVGLGVGFREDAPLWLQESCITQSFPGRLLAPSGLASALMISQLAVINGVWAGLSVNELAPGSLSMGSVSCSG